MNSTSMLMFRRVAILPHKATSPDQIDLEVGDIVGVAGNHWDGYSKGRNLRTNKVGLYPSFKVICDYFQIYDLFKNNFCVENVLK